MKRDDRLITKSDKQGALRHCFLQNKSYFSNRNILNLNFLRSIKHTKDKATDCYFENTLFDYRIKNITKMGCRPQILNFVR